MAQKSDFFNESASSSARDARQYFTDSAFASLINSLPTRVCPMPIGPAVAELSSRDGTHVCPILTFLTISSCHFPHVKATGKTAVFQLVPRVHLTTPTIPFLDVRSSSIRSLRRVQISAGYRPTVRAGHDAKGPRDPKVKQTDTLLIQIV